MVDDLLVPSPSDADGMNNRDGWRAPLDGAKPTMVRRATILMMLGASLSVSACAAGECASPDNWIAASSLPPPRVALIRNPVMISREQSDGTWIVQFWTNPPERISFDDLLRRLSGHRSLRPRPEFVFSFRPDRQCSEKNENKMRIAQTLHCSRDSPCIEGTPDQLP